MRLGLFDNLILKLISLVLGFSLWYIVAGERGVEIVLPIPLEFRGVPEGHEVIDESAQEVDVRLRGSSEVLRTLSPTEVQVAADLSGARPGANIVYLTPDHIETPYGIRVMRVRPASVEVTLDRTVTRTVRAVPRVVGEPASGFELQNIFLHPSEFRVSGPASRLKSMEQITTEPISAEGLRETFTQSARVVLDDPFVRLTDRDSVEVTLVVREESLEREINGVPLGPEPDTPTATFEPSSVRVVVGGPRSQVERLRPEHLRAVVELSKLGEGRHTVTPRVEISRPDLDDVEVRAVRPKEIRIRISSPSSK